MKICPKCGSDNVDWIIPQNWSLWECRTCGYTGPIIEGDIETAIEIQKEYLKNKEKEKKNKNNEKYKNKEDNSKKSEKEFEEDLSDEEIEKQLDELNI